MSAQIRCAQCGEYALPDHGGAENGWGHTRSEHDQSEDWLRSGEHDCRNCPVAVSCGPMVLAEDGR